MKRILCNLGVFALLCASAFGQAKPKATVNAAIAPPSVSLSWTASAGNPPANIYNVYRGTAVGSLSVIGSSATTSFTDNSVAFGTVYYYAVTGVNTATCPSGMTCESAQSTEVSATIPGNPVPAPPTGLTVGTITATNVPLQWNAPAWVVPGYSLTGYGIYNCSEATCPGPPLIGSTTATNYSALPNKERPYYLIRATYVNPKGKTVDSADSNIVKAQAN
jgi:hypothetical protein